MPGLRNTSYELWFLKGSYCFDLAKIKHWNLAGEPMYIVPVGVPVIVLARASNMLPCKPKRGKHRARIDNQLKRTGIIIFYASKDLVLGINW